MLELLIVLSVDRWRGSNTTRIKAKSGFDLDAIDDEGAAPDESGTMAALYSMGSDAHAPPGDESRVDREVLASTLRTRVVALVLFTAALHGRVKRAKSDPTRLKLTARGKAERAALLMTDEDMA